MSNATLEELKQTEKEAQRAYSKGTGTLAAAQEAGRAVHRFREELHREAREAEWSLRQERVEAALTTCLPMLRVVASRYPGHLVFALGDKCYGVPHYITGDGVNTLFIVTPEPVGEKIDESNGRQLCYVAMECDETLKILEAAAEKIGNQAVQNTQ